MAISPRNFFEELKRRNVYRAAIGYAVFAWLLVQVATQVFPFFEIPNWVVRLVVLLLIIGFPITLVFSWAFELTPEGFKREGEVDRSKAVTRKMGRKITALIVALATVAAGLMVYRGMRLQSSSSAAEKSGAGPPRLKVSRSPSSLLRISARKKRMPTSPKASRTKS
jgi:hypothetical protein